MGRPLKGPSEINNDVAKDPDYPDDTEQMIGQEQVWQERFKWVVEEVRGTFYIRDNEVKIWVVVVGNSQLKVVVISGLSTKLASHARRWWSVLIYKIPKGEDKILNQCIYCILM